MFIHSGLDVADISREKMHVYLCGDFLETCPIEIERGSMHIFVVEDHRRTIRAAGPIGQCFQTDAQTTKVKRSFDTKCAQILAKTKACTDCEKYFPMYSA
eukprot:Opistho-2@39206